MCLQISLRPLFFVALQLAALAEVKIAYNPSLHLEPSDLKLHLGFFGSVTGQASFPETNGGPLVTNDPFADDFRGGGGRYYRRQFSPSEFNDFTDLCVTVEARVLSSEGSPASTSVQFTTADGCTFGLGFINSPAAVVLYADNGDKLPELPGDYSGQDWLWRPAILGKYDLAPDVRRTYVLELLRQNPGIEDDLIRLSILGSSATPLTARLATLKKRTAVPGLLFGHPVCQGTGKAEWYRLTATTTGKMEAEAPLQIGQHRQLFLDDWIIDRMENLRREPGKAVKYPANPVLRRTKPWDAERADIYGNFIWDPSAGLIRAFYNSQSQPLPVPWSAKPEKAVQLSYAESTDQGLTWHKPLFDIYTFEGDARTAIVYRPRNAHLAGPFVLFDERDPDPSRRYKLFTSDYGKGPAPVDAPPPGIDVAFSPDGLHWRRSLFNPVLPLLSDTAQSVTWDPRINRYVAFVRMRPRGFGRAVGRTESVDFEHWSPPELVLATRPPYQFYSMGVTSYQGIHISTPWIIYNDKKDQSLPPPIMEAELGFSRDGWTWTRPFPGTPFLAVGPPGSPDDKQIRMASSFIELPDRILLFFGMSRDVHVNNMKIETGMATLRLDGFAALAAGASVGRVLTKPFMLEGSRIFINADCDTGKDGSIVVSVVDAHGRPQPGLTAVPIVSNGIRIPLDWADSNKFARLQGQDIRLQFSVRNAKLYSFQVAQR